MTRPRTPQAKALVSGAALKNAGRFKARRGPREVRPVGKPYVGMTGAEVAYWHELVRELPWLHSAHRVLLRMVCNLSARMDEGEIGVSAAHALSSMLSKLGATPVDETKVAHGGGEETDPGEEFFARLN